MSASSTVDFLQQEVAGNLPKMCPGSFLMRGIDGAICARFGYGLPENREKLLMFGGLVMGGRVI
jgi:hypothetical protein